MSHKKVGDTVWVYRVPCAPVEGVISEVLDYGYRVTTDKRTDRDCVHAKHAVFARPDEKSKLLFEMADDAHHLQVEAEKFLNQA